MIPAVILIAAVLAGIVFVAKTQSDPSIQEKRPSCGWGCSTCPNRFVCHREKYPSGEELEEQKEAANGQ